MSPRHTVSTIPLSGNRELRTSLENRRGRTVVDVRVYGAPATPAALRMPTRDGVEVALADLPALRLALGEAESMGALLASTEAKA